MTLCHSFWFFKCLTIIHTVQSCIHLSSSFAEFCLLVSSSLLRSAWEEPPCPLPMHSNSGLPYSIQQADALPTPELRRTLLIPSSQKWRGRWRGFSEQDVLSFGVLFTLGPCQEGPWTRGCEQEGWEGGGGAAGYRSAPRAREILRVGRAPPQKNPPISMKKNCGNFHLKGVGAMLLIKKSACAYFIFEKERSSDLCQLNYKLFAVNNNRPDITIVSC